jgi:HEPN domain-containing protein
MPNRAADWLTQARRDLELARHAAAGAFHEWACFASQQAAEKALKALVTARNGEPRGHSIVTLARALPAADAPAGELLDAARRLDRYYIPARYPNGFDRGAPRDYFSATDATAAIADADRLIAHCADRLS